MDLDGYTFSYVILYGNIAIGRGASTDRPGSSSAAVRSVRSTELPPIRRLGAIFRRLAVPSTDSTKLRPSGPET